VDPAPTRATSAELSSPEGRIHTDTPASTGVDQATTAGRKIRASTGLVRAVDLLVARANATARECYTGEYPRDIAEARPWETANVYTRLVHDDATARSTRRKSPLCTYEIPRNGGVTSCQVSFRRILQGEAQEGNERMSLADHGRISSTSMLGYRRRSLMANCGQWLVHPRLFQRKGRMIQR